LFSNDGNYTAEGRFKQAKQEGVGLSILKNFMGSNWKEWMIKEGLRNIKDEDKVQAIEKIKNPGQAAGFRKALKKVENRYYSAPPEDEPETDEPETDPIQDEPEVVRPHSYTPPPIKRTAPPTPPPPPKPAFTTEDFTAAAERIQKRIEIKNVPPHFKKTDDKMEQMLLEELGLKSEFDAALKMIEDDLRFIDKTASNLNAKILEINGKFRDMGLEKISQVSSIITLDTFTNLFANTEKLFNYLGININQNNK
jgi:hypothetical protein